MCFAITLTIHYRVWLAKRKYLERHKIEIIFSIEINSGSFSCTILVFHASFEERDNWRSIQSALSQWEILDILYRILSCTVYIFTIWATVLLRRRVRRCRKSESAAHKAFRAASRVILPKSYSALHVNTDRPICIVARYCIYRRVARFTKIIGHLQPFTLSAIIIYSRCSPIFFRE